MGSNLIQISPKYCLAVQSTEAEVTRRGVSVTGINLLLCSYRFVKECHVSWAPAEIHY